ncbi:glutamate racemase [Lysinibacter sp. HNR]|uniref:glutamate racemase n=1 Tax=Lysinibacter sp. HNR TaxID=3031408 RepID=UPI002434FE70|nr:glutamate racemase [Lysinibacter sp. HNR]WGD36840.1 glutamate racemase [Lysinibacter sp. HNR]
MNNLPIGIFDSGVGGLTVARAVRDQLPHESITYVGDTAHTPYGPKPIARVREYALSVLDDMVEQGVKMLVIACNTASAAMLRDAHERYDVPVLEVIQPAVRSAVSITKNGRVGLIGTVGTIKSRAYDDLFSIRDDITLFTRACPRFVEFVEEGVTAGPELHRVAIEYLTELKEANIDTLVLGCTHYPFLRGAISRVMGSGVRLVSSDIETANDVYRVLAEHGLMRGDSHPAEYRYKATGDNADTFLLLAERLLGSGVPSVDLITTGTRGIDIIQD